jgi:ATP synthase protein I
MRLVRRVVLLQTGCAALAAAAFWALEGAAAGRAALQGGMIVAVGSALFGWRLFAPGIAPAPALRRALFAAESLKWLWIVFALWAALARWKTPPLPLVAGLVFAQFGYWVGMVRSKRTGGS